MQTIYADKRAAAAAAATKVAIFGQSFKQTKDQMMQVFSRCRFVSLGVSPVCLLRVNHFQWPCWDFRFRAWN